MSKRRRRSGGVRKRREPDPNRRPRVLVLEGLSGTSKCIARAGGVGLNCDPTRGSAKVLSMIADGQWDALVLTGGSDVDPRLYGEKKIHKRTYGINEVRDRVEMNALAEARRRGVPVLGICRGVQIMNVEAGGTLKQHIGNKHRNSEHVVTTTPNSILAKAVGEEFWIISLHHQEVKAVAPDWQVVARSKFDNVVEALEGEDGRCLGVQFHPEMEVEDDYSRAIFRWLVTEAAARANVPVPVWPPAKPRLVGALKTETRTGTRIGWGEWDYGYGLGWEDLDDPMDYVTGEAEDTDDLLNVKSLLADLERDDDLSTVRHRRAGTQTKPRAKKANPVTYLYYCRCHGLRFDERADRDGHEALFAGVTER